MFSFSRRLIYALSNKFLQKRQEYDNEKKLTVDFSKSKKHPFDIKSESSFNAYLSNAEGGRGHISLTLGLKKTNCIAWVEIPEPEYRDHIIEAKISLDSLGGYASTGIIFRIMHEESYYLALVSSKGYFRLDVVKDNSPKALIAWTEISGFNGKNIKLNIITYGSYLIFLVNDKWVGETTDDSIDRGRVGFVLASYEEGDEETEAEKAIDKNEFTCKSWLEYISIDSQVKSVEEKYKKWTDELIINAEERLRLAETFAVMGEAEKALEQLNKAWKRRSEAIKVVSATDSDVRTKKELLLAARMSFRLGQYSDSEDYFNQILEQWPSSDEGKAAFKEKLQVLYELNKFPELKEYVLKNPDAVERDLNYYTMTARCYWELQEYAASALAWERAYEMNSENAIYAVNAANAYELTGNKEKAIFCFLEAGRKFLKQDNMPELAAMMPKLSMLGENDWEARVLAGKWSFSLEDYDRCEREFTIANKLRCSIKPRPKADPAHYYLWGLTLNLKGRHYDSIRLLEKAVKLAPDYGLFRFKLVEAQIQNGEKSSHYAAELKTALEDIGDDPDGTLAAHAGNLLLKIKDTKNAQYFQDLAKAKQTSQQGNLN
jgi:tetratricopeptide (TPR) repeat protein